MFQDVTPAPEPDPRRKAPRMSAVLAVELSSKDKPRRCGVTRNASENGLLIITPSRFSVGDELAVSVLVGPQHGRIGGRVVRVEENDAASAEVWRYRLAVELEGALPEELLEEARAYNPFGKTRSA